MNKKECKTLSCKECKGVIFHENEKTFLSSPACYFSNKTKVSEMFFMEKPCERHKDCFIKVSCFGVDLKRSGIVRIYDNSGENLIKEIRIKDLFECFIYHQVS